MDVIVTTAGTRLHSRMPAGERGKLGPEPPAGRAGDRPSFRPSDLTFFDEADARIAARGAPREARERRRCLRHGRRSGPARGRAPQGAQRSGYIAPRARPARLHRRPRVPRRASARPVAGARVRARRTRLRRGVPGARDLEDRLAHGRARARVARDRARARHGARLGREHALAAAAAPQDPADPPDRRARDRERARLVVPLLAASGLPQRAAAASAVVAPSLRGPRRHLHAAVDRHRHRPRAHLVHLPLRQRRLREHQRRAARGGAGGRVITGGRLLPRDAAAAAALADLRRRRGPPARAGTVHGAAAARLRTTTSRC